MPLVVDGSAALGWTFEDEQTPELIALLGRVVRERASSTSLFPLETANVVLLAARRGRITDAKAKTYLAGLGGLGVDLDTTAGPQLVSAIYDLAARHKLTIYDAAYLELALRLGGELATLDEDLAAAAKAEGVALVDLGH
jgi:predicted nucleic acid-binding protein